MLRGADPTSREAEVDVSVIVPCGGSLAYLCGLVEGLLAQQTRFIWEIVFVDNRLPAHEREALDSATKTLRNARVVDESSRPGIGPARNAGAHAAAGRI